MILASDIKAVADIMAIVGETVELRRRSGKQSFGLCPFHSEKTPSFAVHSEKGIFKCFGCGVGGDVIDWVMRTESTDFRGAIRSLAARYDLEPDSPSYLGNMTKLKLASHELRAFDAYLSGLRDLWLSKRKDAEFNLAAAKTWLSFLIDLQPPKALSDKIGENLTKAQEEIAFCEDQLDVIDFEPSRLIDKFLRVYYSRESLREALK